MIDEMQAQTSPSPNKLKIHKDRLSDYDFDSDDNY